jgi:serine/threonine-protein kinase
MLLNFQQQQEAIAQSTTTNNNMTISPFQSSTTTRNFLTYTNSNYGITIHYPSDWKIGEHVYTNRFVLNFTSTLKNNSDTFPATITVSVEPLKQNRTTLNEFTITTLDNAKQSLPNFQLIESNATTLASNPAHRIVYTFTSSDPSVQLHFQSMNIWTLKENKVYSISYTQARSQFNKYLPIIQNMIHSFDIIK